MYPACHGHGGFAFQHNVLRFPIERVRQSRLTLDQPGMLALAYWQFAVCMWLFPWSIYRRR